MWWCDCDDDHNDDGFDDDDDDDDHELFMVTMIVRYCKCGATSGLGRT